MEFVLEYKMMIVAIVMLTQKKIMNLLFGIEDY